MVRRIVHVAPVLGAALICMGCGDKELEAKSRGQQARIVELQTKVELLSARLGERELGNPEEELERVKSQLKEAEARVADLRAELADLTAQRDRMTAEFEAFKRDYPIPD